MLDRAQLKREAKEINRSAHVSACLFALIYLAITFILQALDDYVSGDVVAYMQKNFSEIPVPQFLLHAEFPTAVVLFVSIAVTLLCFILEAGWALYLLGVRRGETMGYGTLFDGFSFAGKLILLNLLMTIFIALWSMLFVIPGIIASYRYRFAVYNLCENPELGVMEALSMSKAQTAGYKGQLFVLDLSFIGWLLLSSLTMGILLIWVAPYYEQTKVGYFQQIKREKNIGYFPGNETNDTPHASEPFDPERS
ncbi:MAG: DUF975 family protein [Clostridiales bacterium]|nr:DUF975 family protein [Candidatus Cacconaster stercorequi]